MRLPSLIAFLTAGLLAIASGGAALAQYYPDEGAVYRGPPPAGSQRYYERVRPRYAPGPQYGGSYGYRSQSRYQPPPPSGFFFPWFRPAEPAQPAYRPERRRERAAPREARRPRPTPAKPEEPEVEPSTFVAVFGDSLADLVARGLDDLLEENLDIEIVRKTRGDSGLVRTDNYDTAKAIQEFLASPQKITYAVVMIGTNDRQVIREGETGHDPLSERWRELYRERIDAVIRPLVEKRVPVLWVGLPPMKNERLSADFVVFNDIYRERVQKAGGVYVDIWEAFANEENRYSPIGPDVDGEVTRLRSSDGVNFTRAGARKVAHFVDVELKRLIEAKAPAPNVAVVPSSPGGDAAGVERLINAAVPALPQPQGPSLAPRPLAGPVLPLTRVDVSPGGALASGTPRPNPDTAHVVDRALREGVPPAPKPGRADDFSWPKQ
jgi:hypothetical protein